MALALDTSYVDHAASLSNDHAVKLAYSGNPIYHAHKCGAPTNGVDWMPRSIVLPDFCK